MRRTASRPRASMCIPDRASGCRWLRLRNCRKLRRARPAAARSEPATAVSFNPPCGTSAAGRRRDRAATSHPARPRGPSGTVRAAPGRATASPGRRGSSKAAPRGSNAASGGPPSSRKASPPRRGAPAARSAKAPPPIAARCFSAAADVVAVALQVAQDVGEDHVVVGAGHGVDGAWRESSCRPAREGRGLGRR